MNWEERYIKEAFKIKFWERGNNWNKLLKDSPYQNMSEPEPSFKILGPSYNCSLCGQSKGPEDVFKDKGNRFYCKSHYELPKVDTFNVRDNTGNIVSEGVDTKEISKKKRKEVSKSYEKDKKEKSVTYIIDSDKVFDLSERGGDRFPVYANFKERYAINPIVDWKS